MPGQVHPYQQTWTPEAERDLLLSIILSTTGRKSLTWDPIEKIFQAAGHDNFTRNAIKLCYARILKPLTTKLETAGFHPNVDVNPNVGAPARPRRKKTAIQKDPTYVDDPDLREAAQLNDFRYYA